MALRTKTQVRAAIQEWMDDTGAVKWSAANLDLTTALVYDDLWQEILDMAPNWTSHRQAITRTLPSPGYVDLRLGPNLGIGITNGEAIRIRNTFVARFGIDGSSIPIIPQEDVFTATTHDVATASPENTFILSVQEDGTLTITIGTAGASGASTAASTPANELLIGQFTILNDGATIFNATTDNLTDTHLTVAFAEVETPGFLDYRIYRLQEVIRDGRRYKEADPRDLLIEDDDTVRVGPSERYWLYGDKLYLSAGVAGGGTSGFSTSEDVEIRYSHFPTDYDDLLDAEWVEFPDGHINALIYESAARAIARANQEAPEHLGELAEKALRRLRAHVKRRSPGPMIMRGGPLEARDFGGID